MRFGCGDATGSCGGGGDGGTGSFGEAGRDRGWNAGCAAGEDQEQRGVSCAARGDSARCDSGGGVWTDHSAVDAGAAAVREYQSAWVVAAEIPRGCSDSVGGGEWRGSDGRDNDAAGCGARYRRYAAGAGVPDWAGGDGD